VGFVAFDSDIVEHVPPSAKHMETVLHVLDRLKPGRPGSLQKPLHKLAEHFGRRGIVVVISDFYEDPASVLDAIAPLRFRGNDIIVFHVLDPAELEFGFDDAQPFEDLESGDQIPVVPEAFREEYRSLVKAHIDALTQSCDFGHIAPWYMSVRVVSVSQLSDHNKLTVRSAQPRRISPVSRLRSMIFTAPAKPSSANC